MKNFIFAIFILPILFACGDLDLGQVTGPKIRKTDVNDIRTALYQDFVPRDSSGITTTEAGGLGTSTYVWGDSFVNSLTLGSSGATPKISESSNSLVFDTATASTNITGKINGVNAFDCSSTVCSFYSGGSVVADIDANGINTDDIANGAITRAKMESVGQQITSAVDSHAFDQTSYVAVSGLSASITTTGRPVYVGLQAGTDVNANVIYSNGGGSDSAYIYVQFKRDGTVVAMMNQYIAVGGASGTTGARVGIPPSAYHLIDTPSAGSYVYTVEYKTAAGDAVQFEGVKLVAYEL